MGTYVLAGGGSNRVPVPQDVPIFLRFQFYDASNPPQPVAVVGPAAVVTLDAAGRSSRVYLSGVPGLMVRAPSCRRPTEQQYFPAVIYTDDDRPLRPGDRGVRVIVSVPDDDASGYFESGQHFTVWDRTDIGHGTVAERLFFQWR